jgi:ketosteroid isomerase-like protein
MRKFILGASAILIAIAWFAAVHRAEAKSDDQAEIRAMEDRLIKAFVAKDLDGAMAGYLPDETLFVFDAIPPRQYVGMKAWREDNRTFLDLFKGPIHGGMTDLSIVAQGDIGFGHNIQHVSGTGKDGKPIDLTFRVSDGYRKINGKWLIVQEHISFPVDIASGKPDFASKP